MSTSGLRWEPLLGLGVDGIERWRTPRADELGVRADGHDRLGRRLVARAVQGTAGTVAALRGADGRAWLVALDDAGGTMVLTGAQVPAPDELDLAAPLLAAIGFQVSHALRSPLAQLGGHHTLAQRALDRGDLDATRHELAAAAALDQRLLDTADQTASAVQRLVRSDAGAPGDVAALAATVEALLATLPRPTADTRFALAHRDRVGAVIDVPAPHVELADAVASVAGYLIAGWAIDAVTLRVHGRPVTTVPGAGAVGGDVRALAPDELVDQAFAIGRSIARCAAAPPITFASHLGALLAAGARISLQVPLGDAEALPAHDALLVELARSSAAVLA